MVSQTQKSHELFFRSLQGVLSERGCDFMVSHSKTTRSSYLLIGRKNESGGLEKSFEIRLSDHVKPGFRKTGHDKKMRQYIAFTSKMEAHRERIVSLIPVCGGSGQEATCEGNRIVWSK